MAARARGSSYLALWTTVCDAGPLGADHLQFEGTNQGASAHEPPIIEESVHAERLVGIELCNQDISMKI